MRISTKGRYALRLMLDIALHGEQEAVPLREAAARQELSEKYLEQIVTPLSRAGLVRSIRGAGGGYLLTRPAEEYTVGDILRPVEGTLTPVGCVDGTECCGRMDACVTIEVWQQIGRAVAEVVDRITLADLVRRYHEKTE